MKKIGTYKVETSFNISDRGIIALCQIIEGMAKVGAMTNIEFDGMSIPAKIIGYDWPSLGSDEILRCGLLLRFEDERLRDRIASEKLMMQTIEVFVQS